MLLLTVIGTYYPENLENKRPNVIFYIQVAATANNSNCAVGIAYEAGIGGVRMLDGDVTDAVEARSLGLNSQHIDIYSAR